MKQTPFAPLPPTTPARPSPTNLRPSTFQPPPPQSFLLSSSSFCSLVLRAFLPSEHRFLLPHPSNSPPCHCSPDTPPPSKKAPSNSCFVATTMVPCSTLVLLCKPPPFASTERHSSNLLLLVSTLVLVTPRAHWRLSQMKLLLPTAPKRSKVALKPTTSFKPAPERRPRLKRFARLGFFKARRPALRSLSHSAETFSSVQLLLPLRAPLGPKLINFLPHKATTPVHSPFPNPSAVPPPSHHPPP